MELGQNSLQGTQEDFSILEIGTQDLVGSEESTLTLVTQGVNRDEEPVQLNFFMPDHFRASSWVLLKVKEIQQFVNMGCEGFENQFLALFMAIESSHVDLKKSGSQKYRELKRLTCSINYEDRASRDRVKGKGLVPS